MLKTYLRAVKEINFLYERSLELIKPLYGFPHANNYWKQTITKHDKTDLSLSETSMYNELYFKQGEEELVGLISQYVDGSLQADKNEFFKNTEQQL